MRLWFLYNAGLLVFIVPIEIKKLALYLSGIWNVYLYYLKNKFSGMI